MDVAGRTNIVGAKGIAGAKHLGVAKPSHQGNHHVPVHSNTKSPKDCVELSGGLNEEVQVWKGSRPVGLSSLGSPGKFQDWAVRDSSGQVIGFASNKAGRCPNADDVQLNQH